MSETENKWWDNLTRWIRQLYLRFYDSVIWKKKKKVFHHSFYFNRYNVHDTIIDNSDINWELQIAL